MRPEKYLNKRWLIITFLALSFLFMLSRVINLEADFPKGINWSGDLYTDEGWFANNAVSYVLTGSWYIWGDWNTAISVPGITIIQVLFFKILGVSLFSARIITILFYMLSVVLLYLIVNRLCNNIIASIVVFIASSNYFLFSYSRLALLEIPMMFFVLLSITLSIYMGKKYWYAYIILIGIFYWFSLMIKTSALFAFPVILYLLLSGKSNKIKILYASIFLMTVSGLYLIYYINLPVRYPEDYKLFAKINIPAANKFGLVGFVRNTFEAFYTGRQIDIILFSGSIITLVYLLIKRNKYFEYKKAITVSVLWIFTFIVMLGYKHYTPARYYVSLAFPVFMLSVIGLEIIYNEYNNKYMIIAANIMIGLMITINVIKIGNYMMSPNYTQKDMGEFIKKYIGNDADNVYILGSMAGNVSLMTRIKSINDTYGTVGIEKKIQRYKPKYLVSMEREESIHRKRAYGSIRFKRISQHDVFGNYYKNRPVSFYQIEYR